MKLNNPIINSKIDTVYCMRHAESEGNARGLDDNSLKNKANHQFDITSLGLEQVELSAQYVRENNLLQDSEVYVSGFVRAQQTLSELLRLVGEDKEVIVDSRLDEWWRGIFHSLSKEEIEKYYPNEEKIQEREGRYHYRAPQGQSGKEVEINLFSFLESVRSKNIFLVGHGRTIGFLYRILTNSPVNLNCEYPLPKNGEIWKFSRTNFKLNKYFEFESLFTPKVLNSYGRK